VPQIYKNIFDLQIGNILYIVALNTIAMKREIKFRAWNENGKYMSYQGEPDVETLTSFIYHYGDDTLMQFTGLKDEGGAGKEVYEDDILASTKDGTLMNWLVVFQNGCFGIRNIHGDGFVNRHEFYPIDREYFFQDRVVIGNLHENPKLLSE
jgi:hypothetical protein